MKQVTKQTFQLFLTHVWPYRGLFWILVATITAGMTLQTVIPLYYKQFFDILAASAPDQTTAASLIRILVTILVLYSIEWVMWRIATFGNNYFQPRVMADLAQTCFDYLHRHSYGFFVNRFAGALVRRINRLIDAFEGIADKFTWDLLPMAIRVIAIIIVLTMAHPMIGAILFLWTVFYLIVNYAFTMYKLKYDEQNATIDSEVTAHLSDTIINQANIKLFSAHADETKGFHDITERQFKIRKFTWDLSALAEAIQSGFMVVIEFGLFFFAVRFWRQGLLTVGHFVLIQVYLIQIFARLWDFGRIIRDLYKHLANAEEMVEILNTPHAVQDKPRAHKLVVKQGAIEFRNVTFSYTRTRPVLEHFNLTVAPGEKIGLVGPSGGGKTTFVALLFRFWDLNEGKILIDDVNIADVTQDSLRESISMVPQDPILFHRTLMENIRYGRRDATDQEVVKAARLAHCDEFIDKLPQKYQTYVGERGVKLSGGERQRVAIARAILKNAPILVLDEATSSLDSHSEALIQDALGKLMKKRTTIVIAHRLSTIMKMDRIVVIRDGRIEETGSHDELVKKKSGLYQKLWALQAGGFITS